MFNSVVQSNSRLIDQKSVSFDLKYEKIYVSIQLSNLTVGVTKLIKI